VGKKKRCDGGFSPGFRIVFSFAGILPGTAKNEAIENSDTHKKNNRFHTMDLSFFNCYFDLKHTTDSK